MNTWSMYPLGGSVFGTIQGCVSSRREWGPLWPPSSCSPHRNILPTHGRPQGPPLHSTPLPPLRNQSALSYPRYLPLKAPLSPLRNHTCLFPPPKTYFYAERAF